MDPGAAVAADALADGLFPLVTNDAALSLEEALAKYKYQPFLEKRHNSKRVRRGARVAEEPAPRGKFVVAVLCGGTGAGVGGA